MKNEKKWLRWSTIKMLNMLCSGAPVGEGAVVWSDDRPTDHLAFNKISFNVHQHRQMIVLTKCKETQDPATQCLVTESSRSLCNRKILYIDPLVGAKKYEKNYIDDDRQ